MKFISGGQLLLALTIVLVGLVTIGQAYDCSYAKAGATDCTECCTWFDRQPLANNKGPECRCASRLSAETLRANFDAGSQFLQGLGGILRFTSGGKR